MSGAFPVIDDSSWQRRLDEFARSNAGLAASGRSTAEVLAPLLDFVVRDGQCPYAQVWSVDPRRRRLLLVSDRMRRPAEFERTEVVEIGTSYTGEAVEQGRFVEIEDVRIPRRGRTFECPEILELTPARGMGSLPIRNLGNPHQILYVLNLFTPGHLGPRFDGDEWRSYAGLVAASIEASLRERAFRGSRRVAQELGALQPLTRKAACRTLAEHVVRTLGCDHVSVYFVDWRKDRLRRRASAGDSAVGLDELSDETVPRRVVDVWEANREYLAPDLGIETSSNGFFEVTPSRPARSALLVPLHDAGGHSRGALRCVYLEPPSNSPPPARPTYDDVAIAQEMAQAFGPPLDTLLAAEQREVALQKLAHELRVPVVAFRAVLERMEQEYDEQEDFRFRFPHFREAGIYVDLMNRLVKELDVVRLGPSEIPLVRQPTRLESDVIMPLKRFVRPLLRKRGFPYDQPTYRGFDRLPPLMLDAALITQILFNLVENAVKYFPKERNPDDFECVIDCSVQDDGVEIAVVDNGPGIPEEDVDGIFQFGYRSPLGVQASVAGGGLGLWVSRGVAKRLGGQLRLSSRMDPTRFILSLPHKVAKTRKYPFIIS